MKLLPLNVQSFALIREYDKIYVDKTDFVYRLAQDRNYYFISRPRRFGKSLLCSTLKCYFEGRRDLFTGLKIEQLETEWKHYPVMHLDFNARNYKEGVQVVTQTIESAIQQTAAAHGVTLEAENQAARFGEMLARVHEATGMPVVLIFDEYDKPLLETMDYPELHEQTRSALRAFYGNLKTASDHIRFALLTGVTKFSRLSIFSDLNNLTDISLSKDYATLLGITKAELHEYFDEYVDVLAAEQKMTKQQAYDKMRQMYDGYHFAERSEGVYNPYSVINCFNDKRFGHYWSDTAMPYSVSRLLLKGDYDVSDFVTGVRANATKMGQLETTGVPIGMMYQAGYLTIKGFNRDTDYYTLGFPNEEVRSSFVDFLLPQYFHKDDALLGDEYSYLKEDAIDGNVDSMMTRIRRIIAGVPCETTDPERLELHYRTMMFMALSPLGFDVQCERAMLAGVIDMVVTTKNIVYVFELKRGDALQQAADQIVRKQYVMPWVGSERRVIALAVTFDNDTRNISAWKEVHW